MKEPLMRIGKSQMRVPSNRSSEMRLHLNRVGTAANCNWVEVGSLELFAKNKTRQSHKVNSLQLCRDWKPGSGALLLVKDER